MKKPNKDALAFSRHIHDWLTVYSSSLQSNSTHTVKNYKDAMSLYLHYLTHVKGIDANTFTFTLLERSVIEEWILWLKNDRKCSPETCNNRLASIRAFIKYLSERDVGLMYLAYEVAQIPRQKTLRKKVKGLSKNAAYRINRNLKQIGLDIPLTTYVARYVWVSIAQSKNVPLSVISNALGHDSEQTTRIYLGSLDTSVVDKANSLILS